MKNRIIKVIISLCFILLAIGAVRGDYFSVIDVLQKSVDYDNSRSVEKMQEDFDAFLNTRHPAGMNRIMLIGCFCSVLHGSCKAFQFRHDSIP